MRRRDLNVTSWFYFTPQSTQIFCFPLLVWNRNMFDKGIFTFSILLFLFNLEGTLINYCECDMEVYFII